MENIQEQETLENQEAFGQEGQAGHESAMRRDLSLEIKMIALYAVTTVILYGSFWVGWYSGASSTVLLVTAIVLAILSTIAYFLKSVTMPVLAVFMLSAAIGLSICAFFVIVGSTPSRFWGACLLVMLAYKGGQALLGGLFQSRRGYYSFFAVFCFLEFILIIIVGLAAAEDGNTLAWQVFYALVICFFYSCGQIVLRKNVAEDESIWKTAAKCFLMGFVLIFLLILLIAISLAAEEDAGIGELFGAMGDGATRKRKKKMPKIRK